MKIEQFEDKPLSHYSYAILSEQSKEVVLIDPARNPQPYYDYAQQHQAKIIGVIETHPHADFVSGHLEIQEHTGARRYASALMVPEFDFVAFDEGAVLEFGEVRLAALNTPGHSPDSISVVLSVDGEDKAVFTGDTLFIGDCGRPDLRESGMELALKREELAGQMYHSLRQKLMPLADEALVYPAHGAGSLCGKALSKDSSSTMGQEKINNWSLQDMDKAPFIAALTSDQPFIPKYFPYNVDLNKKGAPALQGSLGKITIGQQVAAPEHADRLDPNLLIVDTRPASVYQERHLSHSINIMDGDKFETWLGTLVAPGTPFYLAGSSEAALIQLMERIAKIGYEPFIREAFVLETGDKKMDQLDVNVFKENPSSYTIVDIRNESEVKGQPVFANALNIPLPELQDRVKEIPTDKPIVVHCAGGYRSAAGSSILQDQLDGQVYDLSEHIKSFMS